MFTKVERYRNGFVAGPCGKTMYVHTCTHAHTHTYIYTRAHTLFVYKGSGSMQVFMHWRKISHIYSESFKVYFFHHILVLELRKHSA